ncbi:unnamed protein product [Allacma fusca]|uniref:Protein KTI12 homolog n=1 Tax=Allacma fusca TaxID=39272 RepID=A0A8J2P615_9HEXA|nr:unnamed protein product [Allacma fusca]
MPLIVMCGYPSSGKSTWARKLSDFIKEEYKQEAIIVSEEALLREPKNDILDDSRKEKELRAKVKSEAQRVLNKDTVVIIDALNYIKGYRYEIFCMSKAVPTRQLTVQCEISPQQAWAWNENRDVDQQYTKTVFDHLIDRFELPDSQNRWDSPYFSVLADEELDLKAVCASLFASKQPKPNQSTVNKPVSEINFLPTIEKVASEIIQAIAAVHNSDSDVEEIEVPYATAKIKYNTSLSITQLTKLKRQFITLTKNTTTVKKEVLGDMFVQYLNSQIDQER